MKRWEIYWAEVPFEEKDGSKIRPVVILNDRTAFVISFGIYSASPPPFTRSALTEGSRLKSSRYMTKSANCLNGTA